MVAGRLDIRNGCAIAHHRDSSGLHAFGDDAFAHVVPKHDHPVGPAQRPPVEALPHSRHQAAADQSPLHGHVRVKVADIVDERHALERSHEGGRDPYPRRVGHGDHGVSAKGQSPWNGQREVGQVVAQAPAYPVPRQRRGANTFNDKIVSYLAVAQVVGVTFSRVV